MKLVRHGPSGQEQHGIVDQDGQLRDLSGRVDAGEDVLDPAMPKRLQGLELASLPVVRSPYRLGPCVAKVGKIIGVGLNYHQHALESGMAAPAEPVLFTKATTALSGPNDDVFLPPYAAKTDWEVELAVIIGRRAKNVPETAAFDYVAGYSTMNDISDRALQLEGTGQWFKGKSLDGFAPLGPWFVTADEVPDPQNLRLWLSVNDEMKQDSSTADMLFPVRHLVSYISRHMTLMPGDIIATGTPQGVGMGHKPPTYLRTGDVMKLSVEGLGVQQQVVRAE
ncbi:MAG TPA: fumarylacetoacetate hydrolase family protein [Trueperaceae bacterium]|nr:fumarylacetoacetate hydrolase family protein [Trueperaceae bacterium]